MKLSYKAILTTFCVLLLWGCNVSFGDAFYSLCVQYDISIGYGNKVSLYTNSNWKKEPLNAAFSGYSPRDKAELELCKQALREAFSAYPKNVIQENLDNLVLLEHLSFNGLAYGGTYLQPQDSDNFVYLVIPKHLQGNKLVNHIKSVFHHEFSSILMKNYEFSEEKWKSANPPEYKYKYGDSGGGAKALELGETGKYKTQMLHEKGLLNEYGEASIEEDFNTYSAMLLTYPETFSMQFYKYPRVKKKTRIWMDFYISINPKFQDTKAFEILKEALESDSPTLP